MTKHTQAISRRNALRLTAIAVAAAGVAKPSVIRTAFAQDKGPIKIGFPVPLSGIYGDYAKDQVNGAQLAISQLNAKGGVLGRKVSVGRYLHRKELQQIYFP
jgi:branched-chain amino acid transport system substrate-binding protein